MAGSKSAKVLFLSYDGLTDPLGQSQILPYLIGLSARGFEISIVSFEKADRFEQRGLVISSLCSAHGIQWTHFVYHKNPPVLSTVYDLLKLRAAVVRLHKQETFNIVHCRSYLTALVGLFIKRKYGVKFVFDMRGFWADERVEGNLWNLRNPLFFIVFKFFKKRERTFLAESDFVVSLTHKAKDILLGWGTHVPISVIPCCVDTELFDPSKIEASQVAALRNELGIGPTDFVLTYVGSWGTWYLTEQMLDFFDQVMKRNQNARFLILTPDVEAVDIHGRSDNIIVTKAEREQVPLYLALSSASVLFIKPSFSKSASSATKMAELLAMNIPVITNPGWGDIARLVEEGMASYADQFLAQSVIHRQVDTRMFCRQNFGLQQGIESYERIYLHLTAPSGSFSPQTINRLHANI
jgi:glycosyltransferase involved in cell wall biosynthesis